MDHGAQVVEESSDAKSDGSDIAGWAPPSWERAHRMNATTAYTLESYIADPATHNTACKLLLERDMYNTAPVTEVDLEKILDREARGELWLFTFETMRKSAYDFWTHHTGAGGDGARDTHAASSDLRARIAKANLMDARLYE